MVIVKCMPLLILSVSVSAGRNNKGQVGFPRDGGGPNLWEEDTPNDEQETMKVRPQDSSSHHEHNFQYHIGIKNSKNTQDYFFGHEDSSTIKPLPVREVALRKPSRLRPLDSSKKTGFKMVYSQPPGEANLGAISKFKNPFLHDFKEAQRFEESSKPFYVESFEGYPVSSDRIKPNIFVSHKSTVKDEKSPSKPKDKQEFPTKHTRTEANHPYRFKDLNPHDHRKIPTKSSKSYRNTQSVELKSNGQVSNGVLHHRENYKGTEDKVVLQYAEKGKYPIEDLQEQQLRAQNRHPLKNQHHLPSSHDDEESESPQPFQFSSLTKENLDSPYSTNNFPRWKDVTFEQEEHDAKEWKFNKEKQEESRLPLYQEDDENDSYLSTITNSNFRHPTKYSSIKVATSEQRGQDDIKFSELHTQRQRPFRAHKKEVQLNEDPHSTVEPYSALLQNAYKIYKHSGKTFPFAVESGERVKSETNFPAKQDKNTSTKKKMRYSTKLVKQARKAKLIGQEKDTTLTFEDPNVENLENPHNIHTKHLASDELRKKPFEIQDEKQIHPVLKRSRPKYPSISAEQSQNIEYKVIEETSQKKHPFLGGSYNIQSQPFSFEKFPKVPGLENKMPGQSALIQTRSRYPWMTLENFQNHEFDDEEENNPEINPFLGNTYKINNTPLLPNDDSPLNVDNKKPKHPISTQNISKNPSISTQHSQRETANDEEENYPKVTSFSGNPYKLYSHSYLREGETPRKSKYTSTIIENSQKEEPQEDGEKVNEFPVNPYHFYSQLFPQESQMQHKDETKNSASPVWIQSTSLYPSKSMDHFQKEGLYEGRENYPNVDQIMGFPYSSYSQSFLEKSKQTLNSEAKNPVLLQSRLRYPLMPVKQNQKEDEEADNYPNVSPLLGSPHNIYSLPYSTESHMPFKNDQKTSGLVVWTQSKSRYPTMSSEQSQKEEVTTENYLNVKHISGNSHAIKSNPYFSENLSSVKAETELRGNPFSSQSSFKYPSIFAEHDEDDNENHPKVKPLSGNPYNIYSKPFLSKNKSPLEMEANHPGGTFSPQEHPEHYAEPNEQTYPKINPSTYGVPVKVVYKINVIKPEDLEKLNEESSKKYKHDSESSHNERLQYRLGPSTQSSKHIGGRNSRTRYSRSQPNSNAQNVQGDIDLKDFFKVLNSNFQKP